MVKRITFLDYMRVMACFMVIMVHSCEFFFIDGAGIGIRSLNDGFWVSVIDSAFRCSVPLFVMISAYLLVPVKGDTIRFFKRRFARVVVPFIIWSVLYATLPVLWGEMSGQDAASALLRLTYNFNDASGHMWFVYMIIGIYLVMPVISPWLERVGRRGELCFIALWLLSTFFPYIRNFCGDIYGECYWNEYNILWYFSGFIGYVVLVHYIRHYLQWSASRQLLVGILCYGIGYFITGYIWYSRIGTAMTLQELELSWRFCTPNVVMMSFGAFVIIRTLCLNLRDYKPVKAVSELSYGIYLMHIFVLCAVYKTVEGMWSTPVTILSVGVATFFICIILAKLLSYIPGSRYLIG